MGYNNFIFSLVNTRDFWLILLGAIASVITTYIVRTRERGSFFENRIGGGIGRDFDYGIHVFLSAIVALGLMYLIGGIIYYSFSFISKLPDAWVGLPDLVKLVLIIIGIKIIVDKRRR